jgi:hypothetical protein
MEKDSHFCPTVVTIQNSNRLSGTYTCNSDPKASVRNVSLETVENGNGVAYLLHVYFRGIIHAWHLQVMQTLIVRILKQEFQGATIPKPLRKII